MMSTPCGKYQNNSRNSKAETDGTAPLSPRWMSAGCGQGYYSVLWVPISETKVAWTVAYFRQHSTTFATDQAERQLYRIPNTGCVSNPLTQRKNNGNPTHPF